ncbi:MAG: wax ester/triacylglycerol synthase domain-containing protein, partial [Sciscionella sp.]
LVENANQVAAMPSLHVAWALWVSVVLARISGRWFVQVISGVHVLVTLLVIMATGNHYWLDAAGAAVLVWVAVAVTGVSDRRRVPASDTFFLHVESPAAPQHVGGLVLLDTAQAGEEPTRAEVEAIVRARLDVLPRFTQRLAGGSRWLRQRWVPHQELDWQWHVPLFDVTGTDGRPGGMVGVHAIIAKLAGQPLPRDRPLWRLAVITGIGGGLVAVVPIVHHAVADGIGTTVLAMRLLDPPAPLPGMNSRGPGAIRKGVATVVGLAQLATDGWPTGRLPSGGTAERRFDTFSLPLVTVRAIARAHHARVTDVLLCGIAGGLRRISIGDLPPRLTVAVPLMASALRLREDAAEGNLTAAVMTHLPLDEMPESERLAAIARASVRQRTGSRAIASRFVMHTVGNVLPPVVHGWFARTVYGSRAFHGIASNMPGPEEQLSHAGLPVSVVFPIIPLAPAAPFAVGVLGWDGSFALSVTVDPALADDARTLTDAIRRVFDELSEPAQPRSAG